jgi:hypothetical protein
MDDPHCETCGAEITSGLMAAFCPRGERCEFWPRDADPGSIEMLRCMRGETGGAHCGATSEDRRRLAKERQYLNVGAGCIAVPLDLYEAWLGMCYGVDWNRGTHAKHHRATIERIMRDLDPGLPPSTWSPR